MQVGDLEAAKSEVNVIKQEVDAWLYEQTGGVVQAGPFKGMKFGQEIAWKHTRLGSIVLGCYEEELQGEIERQITRLSRVEKPKISVVGCGEGYYAIGMKMRVPHATVFAVDTDEVLAVCEKNTILNNVELIIKAPIDVFIGEPDLIIMDVEGSEIAYLDNVKYPSLANAYVIVELHDCTGSNSAGEFVELIESSKILLDRFRGSHRINLLLEGPRNPNKHKELCHMTSDYRWMAVSEGRPCLMGWYVMEPKGWQVL